MRRTLADVDTAAPARGGAWVVHAGLFALFLLSIPLVSAAALGALAVHAALRIPRSLPRRFALRLSLLATFAVAYYLISAGHGIVSPGDGVKSAAFIVAAYAIGHAAGERYARGHPGRLVALVVSLAAGLGLYALLCVEAAGITLGNVEITERAVPSVWKPAEVVNGPGLGAMGSLGLCLLPTALLGGGLSRGRRAALRVACAALAAAGALVNVALQNRTPVLTLALSLVAGVLLTLGSSSTTRLAKAWALALVAAVVVGVAYLGQSDAAQALFVVQRFREQRLETARYEAWQHMLGGLFRAPMGGRAIDLGGEVFAHNVWLDVAYDAGLVPLALLLAFHALHVGAAVRVVRAPALPLATRLAVCGLLASFLVTFMVEPSLSFSIAYFAASCYLLGLLLSTSSAVTR